MDELKAQKEKQKIHEAFSRKEKNVIFVASLFLRGVSMENNTLLSLFYFTKKWL